MINQFGVDRKNVILGDSYVKLNFDLTKNKKSRTVFYNEVISHMEFYKSNTMKITDDGVWRGAEYSHILPRSFSNRNLIGFTKHDVVKINNYEDIKFHDGFCNLNSSQAMCMNFFYPLIKTSKLSVLTDFLKIPGTVNQSQFEYESYVEPEPYTKTNFDFFLRINNKNVYFEIKYTEDGFGKADNDEEHKEKYHMVYETRCLKSKAFMRPIGLETFLDNYQIMRNFCVLDSKSYVVFIYPEENYIVRKRILAAKNEFISDKYYDRVILLTWEDLLSAMIESKHVTNVDYSEFVEKNLKYRKSSIVTEIEAQE